MAVVGPVIGVVDEDSVKQPKEGGGGFSFWVSFTLPMKRRNGF